ncbi:MAG: (4Fe-4S)-binding protein [Ignavibacteriae bacterium HGW-Ignavibacteriae-2]|nr:MAG: (4Fe-4S)-binding protein [Ignavibacteriae bacterium HGW-Ignavibacteriae-2]
MDVIISIASGKGGTGKTTVAASLASIIPESVYLDCDVEEPNGHLLLKPEFNSEERVEKNLPEINRDKCTFCGKCLEVCEFNALINLGSEIILFEEMCHSCGACVHFCPSKIITEISKEIGIIRKGIADGNVLFVDGVLNIGEVSVPPLIKEVKKNIVESKLNIIDSPPGTSCSMLEAVRESDFCILVTESTPFGLNDLKLAVDVLKTIKVPFGVVINKYAKSFIQMEKYLFNNGIEVLLKIEFDRRFAEAYSEGILPLNKYPELKAGFIELHQKIMKKMEIEKIG